MARLKPLSFRGHSLLSRFFDLLRQGGINTQKNGIFVVPGLVRMVVVKKPATKERKGINPFTKEATIFKAKPARKVVKGRPVKAAKDAIA